MKPSLVILAAGIGSRYGGIKQIEPIGKSGEIILEYSLFDAIRAGFGKAVFVIREDIRDDFENYLLPRFEDKIPCECVFQKHDDIPNGFSLPRQRVKPWGTAHAVLAARDVINEPFAVINADDFYGRDGLAVMGKFLSEVDPESRHFAMVGYTLANTVSENGTVSRGICNVNSRGYLTGVEEHSRLEKISGGVISHLPDGFQKQFSGNEVVSMNLFGFTPVILPQMWRMFGEFLSKRIAEDESEFYIPWVANCAINSGGADMRVIKSSARWFGITYKEDLNLVVKNVRDLVDGGEYPASLWR